jgi:hypothetical protein
VILYEIQKWLFTKSRICGTSPAIPTHPEGRFAIVTER